MTWVEIVTLAGIGLAIIQIAQVGRVSRAAYLAVATFARRFRAQSIILLVPGLERIEHDCETAVAAKNATDVQATLSRWRHDAGEMQGYLEKDEPTHQSLLAALTASLGAVNRAKGRLGDAEPDGVSEAARDALRTMANVCRLANVLSATMRGQPDIGPAPLTVPQFIRRLGGRLQRPRKEAAE